MSEKRNNKVFNYNGTNWQLIKKMELNIHIDGIFLSENIRKHECFYLSLCIVEHSVGVAWIDFICTKNWILFERRLISWNTGRALYSCFCYRIIYLNVKICPASVIQSRIYSSKKNWFIKIVLMSKRQSYRRVDNNVADYHETRWPPEIDYLEYTSALIEPV